MRYAVKLLMVLTLGFVIALAMREVAAAAGTDALGIVAVEPVAAETCMAVAFSHEDGQAVEGLRWYNNDSSTVFPFVMAVASYPGSPPDMANAIVVLENVSGAEDGWSEVSFSEPVVSPTNMFYVVFQLPANEQVTARGEGPGIGYALADEESWVYFSAERVDWLPMVSTTRLLVEPVLGDVSAKSNGAVLLLPMPTEDEVDAPEVEQEIIKQTELLAAYPNPFNPMTRFAYTLKKAGIVEIEIFDVRGHRVKYVKTSEPAPGRYEYVWRGEDNSQQRVASGVYLVRMKADGYEGIQRVVLLK